MCLELLHQGERIVIRRRYDGDVKIGFGERPESPAIQAFFAKARAGDGLERPPKHGGDEMGLLSDMGERSSAVVKIGMKARVMQYAMGFGEW